MGSACFESRDTPESETDRVLLEARDGRPHVAHQELQDLPRARKVPLQGSRGVSETGAERL